MQWYATPVPKKALPWMPRRISRTTPCERACKRGQMLHLAPSLLSAPNPARWSLIHAHPNLMLLAAAAFALGLPPFRRRRETVVRYGISMADIPLTTGQPDRGAAPTILGLHDLRPAGRLGDGRGRPAGQAGAGLGHRMEGRRQRQEEMALCLAQGFKFHDGSEFNADAVIWNLDKVLNERHRNSTSARARR